MQLANGGMVARADQIKWGVSAQTGVLTDGLRGKPDHFRWVHLNAISAVTFANQERMGYRFDNQRAMHQHRAVGSYPQRMRIIR